MNQDLGKDFWSLNIKNMYQERESSNKTLLVMGFTFQSPDADVNHPFGWDKPRSTKPES